MNTTRTPRSTVAESADYVPFIDGLRGVAILMVMLDHVGTFCSRPPQTPFAVPTVSQFVEAGQRGVQLFFLLSAFTLMRTAHRRYQAHGFDKRDFYIRRAFRILPLWWAVNLGLGLANGGLFTLEGGKRFLLNASFLFGFLRFHTGMETVPGGWSLFVEESFYSLLPFIYGLGLSLVGSIRLLLATMFIAWFWSAFADSLGVPSPHGFVFFFPFSHWFCFAAGFVLYQIRLDRTLADRLNTRTAGMTLDVAALLCTFLFLRDSNLFVATAALALVFVAASSDRSFAHYLTTRPWLMKCGAYCYSIYLLHVPFLEWSEPFRLFAFRALGLNDWPTDLKIAFWFPIVTAVMFVVGALSFRFFEKPCVEWGRRIARHVRTVSTRPAGEPAASSAQ